MSDFPPPRPLPEGIRDRARQHLAEGMAEPHRPSRRTPLAIAAAVVLLAGSGVALTQATGGTTSAAGPTTVSNPPQVRELPPPDLTEMFHARDGWAPADVVDRCAAVVQGVPPKTTWKPLVTTVVHETTLTAFRTGPDGVFFCETTPTSVTASPLIAPDTGGAPARIGFLSPNGSVAGFVQPQVGTLRLHPTGTDGMSAHALIAGDVFLTPDGFPNAEKGVIFTVGADQEVPAGDVPQPSTITIDRPRPEGDRASDEGRRLGGCLDTTPQLTPDRLYWEPGAHATPSPTSEVQLGRYGDLLAVCSVREQGNQGPYLSVVDRSDITGRYASGPQLNGRTIWGTGYVHDFQINPEGGTQSNTRGFAGLITDTGVATITLTREGFPDTTAVIKDGTFLLVGPTTKDMAVTPPGVEVTVRDAKGAVLEVLTVSEG
ncbi:hypothetical protein [Umezawaea sp. NPDC059074]|uniref:hypothetical protein n=1 Tax=Umezawaea sp. NPDC059074 TaxID=3346716 RepID=UPI0036D08366